MDKKPLTTKWLAFGIILLFVGTSIIPSLADGIVSNVMKKDTIRDSPPDEDWNRTYFLQMDSWSNCIQVTPDGGYIVTGDYGGAEVFYLFLLKVDGQGREQWNRSFGEGGLGFGGTWVEVCADNGYIITGYKKGIDPDWSDFWLIKTDLNGNEEWERSIPSGYGSCVKQIRDGGYIVTGSVNDSLLLVKYDGLGNQLWCRTYEEHSAGGSLALTSDGGYIVTGANHYYNVSEYYNLLLMKTDENGIMEWKREYFNAPWPGSSGAAVQQTSDGGYLVGGSNSSDNWPSDMLLLKTDENGIEEWNRTFGPHGYGSWDYGYSVIETTDGDFILGGQESWKVRLIRTHSNGSLVWDQVYLPSQKANCHCLQQTSDNGFIITGTIDVVNIHCFILKLNAGNNKPPMASNVSGPKSGLLNQSYSFATTTTDPDGDSLYCAWDWGDGNFTEWLGPYPSGEKIISVPHAWPQRGTYGIQVKFKDKFGHETSWSEPLFIFIGKKTFLWGRITNLTIQNQIITFNAIRIHAWTLVPFNRNLYTASEQIKVSEADYRSLHIIKSPFIVGIFNTII